VLKKTKIVSVVYCDLIVSVQKKSRVEETKSVQPMTTEKKRAKKKQRNKTKTRAFFEFVLFVLSFVWRQVDLI
jgi:hypothetical protein